MKTSKFFTWISILVTHIYFVRARKAQGVPEESLAYKAPLGVAGSYRAHEVDVGDQDRDPGEETEDGDEVHEVLEHGFGVAANVHVARAQSTGCSRGKPGLQGSPRRRRLILRSGILHSIEIQVRRPKMVTRFTKYLNTVLESLLTFM
jgi:hypothetical protein